MAGEPMESMAGFGGREGQEWRDCGEESPCGLSTKIACERISRLKSFLIVMSCETWHAGRIHVCPSALLGEMMRWSR